MISGPFGGGKRTIRDAQETSGRDKLQPGTYYVLTTRGVFVSSKNIEGAEYFGVETVVKRTIVSFSAEENAPYARSQRVGETGSWTFNLNPSNSKFAYLPAGNVKNLTRALMDTHGFYEALAGHTQYRDEVIALYTKYTQGDETADPFSYVANMLAHEGGEMLTGLPLRIVAVDGRNKKNPGAHLFPKCVCYAVDEDEYRTYYTSTSAT